MSQKFVRLFRANSRSVGANRTFIGERIPQTPWVAAIGESITKNSLLSLCLKNLLDYFEQTLAPLERTEVLLGTVLPKPLESQAPNS